MRLLVSIALAAVIGLAAAEPDAALLQKLRHGGYVLYLRHASTDFSQNDSRMTSFEDCSTQRNLTDKGRAEARHLGQSITKAGIPIGAVYASPFCRTMETARLAFGEPQLATPPATGKNNVISSHGNPFFALYGPPCLAEGEIAVVEPATQQIVGRIRLQDW